MDNQWYSFLRKMDIGTAGFIFMSGIVTGPRMSSASSPIGELSKALKLSLPTLILGVGRTVAIRMLNYQVFICKSGTRYRVRCPLELFYDT